MAELYRIMKLRRTATILGTLGVLLSIPCSVFTCMAGSFQRSVVTPFSIVSGLSWLIVWIMVIIARRWMRTGGIMLILSSIPYFYIAIFFGLSTFFLPYITFFLMYFIVAVLLSASGILFIVSWRKVKRRRERADVQLTVP